jgi:predicted dehydrogenase
MWYDSGPRVSYHSHDLNPDPMKSREIKSDLNRRQFLGRSAKNAAGVAAGVVGLSASVARADQSKVVRVGIIGVRNQGRTLAQRLAAMSDVEVAALCDVDMTLVPAAMKAVEEQASTPRWEPDFRRILDDKTIDAVVIATPDHWHAVMAVMACQAGKDVYVEKPVSHTVQEGERLVAAARAYDCVVQSGLQQRSGEHFKSAIETVRSGKLGTVRLAKAWISNARKPLPRRRDESVPQGVNYDLWLGPATERSFSSNQFHHHWHSFWDFGTGELGNWGVHLLDVARWGLELDLPARISASGGQYVFQGQHETPDTLMVNFDYPDHTIAWEHRLWSNHGNEGRGSGVSFFGEKGTLVVDRSGWKVYDSKERLTSDTSDQLGAHLQNFVDCIRSRNRPNADIEIGHTSTTMCHLGNIAFRVGHEVRFDQVSQSFFDSPDADLLLSKSYRAPWSLPSIG